MPPPSALRVILVAGLICGTLDALGATAGSAFFGRGPVRMFQGIASGVLGSRAFERGLAAAALGLLLHFVVATGAAAVFYFASRAFPFLIDHAPWVAPLYGAAVHTFMNFVVIPLSAIGQRPFQPRVFATFVVIAMVVVGPSIVLTVRYYSR